jgi:transposase
MPQPNDLSRSLVALDQNSTIIAVVELSQSSWLVGGVVPGIERQPCKSWTRARNGCLRARRGPYPRRNSVPRRVGSEWRKSEDPSYSRAGESAVNRGA